jgi:hypothetical protein
MSNAAFAACLLDDYSLKAEYARSAAVVRATVVSERTVPDAPTPDSVGGVVYTVNVQESFRGKLRGTVEVFSENSSGRFTMAKESAYVLFLYREKGRLSVDNCGNSGLASDKKSVLAALRAPVPQSKH